MLDSLNQAYQMERHDELYFTIWYGVYHAPTRRLRYASAGHPPPILVSGPRDAAGEVQPLPANGPCIGMSPTARYQEERCVLPSPARLFVFSDGTYEVGRPDGSMLEFSALAEALSQPVAAGRRSWTGCWTARATRMARVCSRTTSRSSGWRSEPAAARRFAADASPRFAAPTTARRDCASPLRAAGGAAPRRIADAA